MSQLHQLDRLTGVELKQTLEGMAEPDRYAEIMRRVSRGEAIPRKFRFFVSYYEGINLGIAEKDRTFQVTEKMLAEHKKWLEMMHKRWKQGGCGNILPMRKKP